MKKDCYSVWCVSNFLYYIIYAEYYKNSAPFKIVDDMLLNEWKISLISKKGELQVLHYVESKTTFWDDIKQILEILKNKCNIEILSDFEMQDSLIMELQV